MGVDNDTAEKINLTFTHRYIIALYIGEIVGTYTMKAFIKFLFSTFFFVYILYAAHPVRKMIFCFGKTEQQKLLWLLTYFCRIKLFIVIIKCQRL